MIKIYDWSIVILLSMTKNVYCIWCYRRKSPTEMILKDHFNLRQWLFLCVWLTTCIMLICMLMIDVSGNVYVHALLVDIALPLAWAGWNLNMWLCVLWMARIALSVFKERPRRHGEAKDRIVRTLQHSPRWNSEKMRVWQTASVDTLLKVKQSKMTNVRGESNKFHVPNQSIASNSKYIAYMEPVSDAPIWILLVKDRF